MGSHDAHYAGELVDGARILGLFGDVATELLIRLDGDEGLFRAYEAIEFLAPVKAGDYIEATGVISKVGTTSRTMAFEARKVVQNLRDASLAASAADALADPVVVCRALGTCVVPRELQRRPRLVLPSLSAAPPDLAQLPEPRPIITPPPRVIVTPPSGELILTAAIVGAEITREQTPWLPITAKEIAEEAARCRDAGVAVIHLHVRTPDGAPSQDAGLFGEAVAAIREKTDVIVQASTGGAVGMSGEERAQVLQCRPEMATLNCGTLNFGNDVFQNPRPLIRDLCQRIHAAGSVPELECYEVGHVDEALRLHAEGVLKGPLHFQFVLGVPGGIGAREDVVRFLVSQIPPGATWGVAAVGRHQRPMTELAMRLGGHARVGLEDNIYLEKGVLAEGSAPLVARAAAYARSVGREVVDPARARQLLGISGATVGAGDARAQ
ncbi:3-keto-5-aminohexanoate cleavage protein [Chondromyces apiculatus]|uniref:bifunctional 3-aminobutyryl-CoA ammonia lyase/3-keto-5-aminohexanoate cleavage enzyme n=1 Tax=Chondromyces apiculatus TaxID=51 RepID=UPI0023DDE694|nr:3-keto-5-aminohexanoate cleavage protein [Chondromyces apiculatus]